MIYELKGRLNILSLAILMSLGGLWGWLGLQTPNQEEVSGQGDDQAEGQEGAEEAHCEVVAQEEGGEARDEDCGGELRTGERLDMGGGGESGYQLRGFVRHRPRQCLRWIPSAPACSCGISVFRGARVAIGGV